MIALGARLATSGSHEDARVLEAAMSGAPIGSDSHAYGVIALARWHLEFGSADIAARLLEPAQAVRPDVQSEVELLLADCRIAEGRQREALGVLSRLTGKHSRDASLLLRVAKVRLALEEPVPHGSGPVIEVLNASYRNEGLAMVWRPDVLSPPSITNLKSGAPSVQRSHSAPVVTIVTWVGSSGRFGALDSLLDQSWGEIEVVVMLGRTEPDDEVMAQMTADSRVRTAPIRSAGASPWETAVGVAVGDFVALQPPHSWAHPQRVESQLAPLLADPTLRGTVATRLVVGESLSPQPLGTAGGLPLVGPSAELLMMRTTGWSADDAVRFGNSMRARTARATGVVCPTPDVEVVGGGAPLVLVCDAES